LPRCAPSRDSLVTQKGYTFLLAHVRCHPRDVESAIAAGADGLNFYIGTSPESRQFNHGHDLDALAQEGALAAGGCAPQSPAARAALLG
jgi:hypothetical protein